LRKILLYLLILFITAGLIVWYISDNILFNYLTVEKPLNNPNLLVLEGWLYDNEVEEAIKLFQNSSYKYIITTGVNTSDFFMMGMNGDLIVNAKRMNIQKGQHQLTIEAYSTLANNESGQFEARVDNERVGGSYTTTKPIEYSFNFEADSTTDSIIVRFLNDALYKEQDINFYISSISVDNHRVSVNDTLNYYRTNVNPGWKNILAQNNAIRLKHVLMQYNFPSDKIIPICTYSFDESRTAETAKNTLQKLETIFGKDTLLKMNVLSRKPHTRRTYTAYCKHANNNQQIGIVSSSIYISSENSRLKNLREFLGIIYLKISPK
jgi:hypothetical protein